MRLIYILLICILILVLLFLILWALWRFFRKKESGSSLFGEGFPLFFRGMIKKLNPFLIVKRSEKNIESKTNNGPVNKEPVHSGEIINVSQGPKGKERVQGNVIMEKQTVGGKNSSPTRSKEVVKRKKKVLKSGFLIKIDDLNELSKRLKDKDVAYIFDFLKKENYSLVEKLFLNKAFKSEREFMTYFKGEFVRFLNSEVTLLKGRVSDLRKKGKDVSELDLKIMVIPLKIRLFSATFSKKDLDKVTNLLKESAEGLKIMEEQLVTKEKIEENA